MWDQFSGKLNFEIISTFHSWKLMKTTLLLFFSVAACEHSNREGLIWAGDYQEVGSPPHQDSSLIVIFKLGHSKNVSSVFEPNFATKILLKIKFFE